MLRWEDNLELSNWAKWYNRKDSQRQKAEKGGPKGEIWGCYTAAFERKEKGDEPNNEIPSEAGKAKKTDSSLELREGMQSHEPIFKLLNSRIKINMCCFKSLSLW